MRNNLSQCPIFPPRSLKLRVDRTNSSLSQLRVQLTPSRLLTTLIEPITGRFGLQKPSPMVMRGERYLNEITDPATKAHETILRIRFMTMQEEIETRARSMGWDVLKMLSPRMQDLKRWFGSATMYLM